MATELSPRSINALTILLALPSTPQERDQYWHMLIDRVSGYSTDSNTFNGIAMMMVCNLRTPGCLFETAPLNAALNAFLARPQPGMTPRFEHIAGAFKV